MEASNMSDYENAIEIKNLTKRYDGFTLDNISFNVPKGSIMGFIGQNGAGKSTTINTILNIIKADSGEIRVFGKDTRTADVQIKQDISAVFDELPFHEQEIRAVLKGHENEAANSCGTLAQRKASYYGRGYNRA